MKVDNALKITRPGKVEPSSIPLHKGRPRGLSSPFAKTKAEIRREQVADKLSLGILVLFASCFLLLLLSLAFPILGNLAGIAGGIIIVSYWATPVWFLALENMNPTGSKYGRWALLLLWGPPVLWFTLSLLAQPFV